MLPDIIHRRFDATTHASADERIPAWAIVTSPSLDVTVRPEHRDGFAASLDVYPAGSVLRVDSGGSGAGCRAGPRRGGTLLDR